MGTYMTPHPKGRCVSYQDYAAQSSQLEAANQRAEMLANSLATARADGYAEGLRDAMNAVGCLLPEHGAGDPQDSTDRLTDMVRREDYSAIAALA
jgi:hypothetical protein